MKLDLVSVWKNVSQRESVGSEAKPVAAIELSDDELAGVVGAWSHKHHRHHNHHNHHRHHRHHRHHDHMW